MPRFSQPNLIRVDPSSGRTQAVFPGGIVFPVTPSNSTDSNVIGGSQQARWERQSDGAMVANILGREAVTPGANRNLFISTQDDGTNSAEVDIGVVPNGTTLLSAQSPQLRLFRSGNGATREISCFANGSDAATLALLTDMAGNSTFIRGAFAEGRSRIVALAGIVTAAGAKSSDATGGWDVGAHVAGSGNYPITFTTNFTLNPAVIASAFSGGARLAQASAITGSGCTISVFLPNTAAAIDSAFSFLAIGVQ